MLTGKLIPTTRPTPSILFSKLSYSDDVYKWNTLTECDGVTLFEVNTSEDSFWRVCVRFLVALARGTESAPGTGVVGHGFERQLHDANEHDDVHAVASAAELLFFRLSQSAEADICETWKVSLFVLLRSGLVSCALVTAERDERIFSRRVLLNVLAVAAFTARAVGFVNEVSEWLLSDFRELLDVAAADVDGLSSVFEVAMDAWLWFENVDNISWMSIIWSPRRIVRFSGAFPERKSFTWKNIIMLVTFDKEDNDELHK